MIVNVKKTGAILLAGIIVRYSNSGKLYGDTGNQPASDQAAAYVKNNSQRADLKLSKLLDRAIGYLGISYIYGGATAKIGLDCSGLVMAAFKAADVEMPRTVGPQKKIGREVKFKKICPGDLIFFYGRGFDSGRVNHVGIYLGSGDFIHSSQAAGEVVIDNFENNSYFRNKIAQIRRVIN
ncbi:MAG: NlpC/P60 family protein [Elusimicrobiota bacterium]|nr:NlpC/P60 family protein [Elusimicrobiota bacterium]